MCQPKQNRLQLCSCDPSKKLPKNNFWILRREQSQHIVFGGMPPIPGITMKELKRLHEVIYPFDKDEIANRKKRILNAINNWILDQLNHSRDVFDFDFTLKEGDHLELKFDLQVDRLRAIHVHLEYLGVRWGYASREAYRRAHRRNPFLNFGSVTEREMTVPTDIENHRKDFEF